MVYSRFNIEAVNPDLEHPDDTNPGRMAALEVTPAGDAAPGEYILVVVQGPALVNASAIAGEIAPGDLLSTSGRAGLAGKAAMVAQDGVETAVPGTVFGKALETLEGTQNAIYVYVTLQ